ncbi:MAG TPA: hypothetical protein PKY56_06260, partial [Candidatus Kapabacteria bacterium]|nr:hypothetical protein [Candidatus Kapabacteria bacterium]
QGDKSSLFDGYMLRQLVRDLKYIVDTNSYLPFTRKGQISIARDRRIKRGSFIRFEPTNELFYVDSVSHEYRMGERSPNGKTTLSVSRGMFEQYIKDPDVSDLSYFKIVRTPIDETKINDKESIFDWKINTLAKWKTDLENFNFFLRRRQSVDAEFLPLKNLLSKEEINEINKNK